MGDGRGTPPVLKSHAATREELGLPPEPPRTPGGVECLLCANAFRPGEGEVGLCGLRTRAQIIQFAADLQAIIAPLEPALVYLVRWADHPL
jgi:hypothetical protein